MKEWSRVGQVFVAHQKPLPMRLHVHPSQDTALQNEKPIAVGREDLAHPAGKSD
jgi:hypothetical protein